MSLHGLHQVWHRRFQAFPADAVRGFPDQDHHLTHRLVVDPPPTDRTNLVHAVVALAKQPDAMLAVVAGYRDELIQDLALIFPGRLPITVPYRRQQLLFRHLAHASCHTNASRFFGSILRAATTSYK